MTRKLILVVDDDASLRRVMKMQLEEAGYTVALAANADEARTQITDSQPKLVITDLRMPGASGMELLAYIREQHQDTTEAGHAAHPGPRPVSRTFHPGESYVSPGRVGVLGTLRTGR